MSWEREQIGAWTQSEGRYVKPAMLKAPFPWFGGKSRAAPLIWEALGDVGNFVDPFFGSGAVLFGRPHPPKIETINDKDGFICNVYRALQADPDTVAFYADGPVNECDLHARHAWLVQRRTELTAQLEGNPDYYDAKIAGWWLWGICCWIGSGWCSGAGPWQVIDGQLVHLGDAGQGIQRRLIHLGNAGQGIQRRLIHLGNAGQGIHRQLVHLGDAGQGEALNTTEGIYTWLRMLSARLRRVRVCCGDWTRVLGPSVTSNHGLTGVCMDPPYSADEDRTENVYAVDDLYVAHDVRKWCLAHGNDPLLRIVLCGYGDVHDVLLQHRWTKISWKANGGMGNQGQGRGRANASRETLWLSPHCIEHQLSLFHGATR